MAVRNAENTIPGTLVSSREVDKRDGTYFMETAAQVIEVSGRGLIKVGPVDIDSKGTRIVDLYNFTPSRFSYDEFDEVVENARAFQPGDDLVIDNEIGLGNSSITGIVANSWFKVMVARHKAMEGHLIAQLTPQESSQ